VTPVVPLTNTNTTQKPAPTRMRLPGNLHVGARKKGRGTGIDGDVYLQGRWSIQFEDCLAGGRIPKPPAACCTAHQKHHTRSRSLALASTVSTVGLGWGWGVGGHRPFNEYFPSTVRSIHRHTSTKGLGCRGRGENVVQNLLPEQGEAVVGGGHRHKVRVCANLTRHKTEGGAANEGGVERWTCKRTQ
jgi:hypothetical protein